MPDKQVMQNLLDQLLNKAQIRPDLNQEKTATMFGRTTKPGDTIESILARFPKAELETGGNMMDVMKTGIPLGFWKYFSPKEKAAVSMYANKFPVSFEKIQKNPTRLTVVDVPLRQGQLGYHEVKPDLNQIGIATKALDQPSVLAHEMTHYMEHPRIGSYSPIDAETIGGLLGEVMQSQGKKPSSLTNVQSLTGGPTPGFAGELSKLATENSPQSFRNFLEFRQAAPNYALRDAGFKLNPEFNQRYNKVLQPQDTMRYIKGEEGMAHLAQFAGEKDAPSLLKLLAARLNILPE